MHARQAGQLRHVMLNPGGRALNLTINLTEFGAVGDGVTDDGPALQRALDVLWGAGGGTLFVPAGHYAIITPVSREFAGRAAHLIIHGEPSPNPPPFAGNGSGLNLSSEFVIATGETADALHLKGLDALLIEDVAFAGVPGASTDARITLNLSDIKDATVHRVEFYGLASLNAGGAILQAYHSALKIDGAAFLGCTTSSSVQASLVQNILWQGVSVTNSKFIDYGTRTDFYSKTVQAPPYSWIAIDAPAPRTNLEPRREALIRHVILDEGALMGVTCLPTTPIDLLFIQDLQMNVSNLGAFGVYVDNVKDLLIDTSHFGWSHNAGAAILLGTVDEAILSSVECVAGADRIAAGQATRQLTIINSTYNHLDSSAQKTSVLKTTAESDPLRYLNQRYLAQAERSPDPAAQMFWTSKLAACGNDAACQAPLKIELDDYLRTGPPASFSIAGQVTDEQGFGMNGVTLSLGGLQQALTTLTDADGNFIFAGLPTSGSYSLTPTQTHFLFTPASSSFEIVSGDQTASFYATEAYSISGRVTQSNGPSIPGVNVTLTGSRNGSAVTDINGDYSFTNLPANGSYTVTPSRPGYTYRQQSKSFDGLSSDRTADFTETIGINGRIMDEGGQGISDVTLILGGSANLNTTTDADGNYSFDDLAEFNGYAYTVVPLKPGYSFTPQAQTITYRNPGIKTLNFTGTGASTGITHSIKGRVLSLETPLSGIEIHLSGSLSSTTTTDAGGSYSFNALPSGTYHLSATQTVFYTFNSQDFINLNSDQVFNFSSTTRTYRIFGQVYGAGAELSGVTVKLSGTTADNATINNQTVTDSSGNYSFTNLPALGSYRVTPVDNARYTFKTGSLTNLPGDRSLNFEGIPRTLSISGRVTDGANEISGVPMNLNGTLVRTTTTNEKGEYIFNDLSSGGDYTVTPSETPFYSFNSQSSLDLRDSQTFNFSGKLKQYTISGRVLYGQTGLAGASVTVTGNQLERTVLTDANGNYSFADVAAMGNYTVKTFKNYFTFNPPAQFFSNPGADRKADFAAQQDARLLVFNAPNYSASEGAGSFALTVTRSGDPSSAATVDYRTSDGTASQRSDYTIVSGTLSFAPGETSKTFSISLIDNAFVDGSRTIKLTLSNPYGATLGTQSDAVLTIIDNDTAPPTFNPIDGAQMFVRQQYLDFLNREPDAGGLRYWSGQITQCGSDAQCTHDRRVGVADAFFFEAEFQQTGAYLYRVYKAAFGLKPAYSQFMSDRGRILSGNGLDQSKSAYALTFVGRDDFTTKYPRALTASVFVDALLNSIKQNSGVDLSSLRNALMVLYDGTDTGRAAILRQVSDAQAFQDTEYNRSFVLMEYFGYLRRDPDGGGFNFWLGQVNKFPLRDVGIQHAMACSFITSAEYQTRFSTIQTSNNTMCPSR
jgi:hypothetical protein